MQKELTLLTTTGERTKAFELCVKWMNRQDYTGPVRWIIVDDGRADFEPDGVRDDWEIMVIQPAERWQPGQNTQARNLRAGLRVVQLLCKTPEDMAKMNLVIIEDDDWYAPDWLTTVAAELGKAELVGEGWARYYNINSRRARKMQNANHASLCSTAMRGGAINRFHHLCEQDGVTFIDVDLWQMAGLTKHIFGGHRVVGMKGLPGRAGIGVGHSRQMTGHFDQDSSVLRDWVGDDADIYLKL